MSSAMSFCLAILLILPSSLDQAREYRTVLLAAHRAGRVEVLDPITLLSLGSIKVLPQAGGVTSDRTGVLFLREGLAPEFQGCCALYAVNLKTHEMTKLLEPASDVAVSPDGQHVVTQRGNVGIEAFSVRTLQREPTIPRSIAPGFYTLSFSPDSRLLFGVSNSPTPTLDILDFDRRKLVQRLTVPQDLTVLGTWVSNGYYLYGYRKGTGQLWRLKADNSALEGPVKVDFPDVASECNMPVQEMLGSGGRLIIYELFGAKGDRRDGCAREIPGGLHSIDPETGGTLAQLAPGFHFASLISSADGNELYGIDVRDTSWTSVGLVRLNAITGEVLASRNLTSDVWSIELATVPSDLVPSGPVEATTNPVNPR
jgi:WD40 repeat protein